MNTGMFVRSVPRRMKVFIRALQLSCGAVCLVAASVASTATVQVQVQEAGGTPLGGAVVFLDSPEAAKAARPLSGAEMVQQSKAFVPEVLVVTRGTAVNFPNRDTVRHHVYSFSSTKQFELKL